MTSICSNRFRAALSLQQPAGLWTNGFGCVRVDYPGDDAMQHCVVGCRISAYCGAATCACAGILFELLQKVGMLPGVPEMKDVKNTLVGCACGQVPVLPCELCCKMAKENGLTY
jgi:hypothetical protein